MTTPRPTRPDEGLERRLELLVAKLARAIAKWDGGTVDGTVWTSHRWRRSLEVIAEEMESTPPAPAHDGKEGA